MAITDNSDYNTRPRTATSAHTPPAGDNSGNPKSVPSKEGAQFKEENFTPEQDKELSQKFSDLTKYIDVEIGRSQQNSTKEIITISSVFVAFFTFISGEFQLIQRFSYIQFVLFSPIFAGILISFVLILLALTKSQKVDDLDFQKIITHAFFLPLLLSILVSVAILFVIFGIGKITHIGIDWNPIIGPTITPIPTLISSPTTTTAPIGPLPYN